MKLQTEEKLIQTLIALDAIVDFAIKLALVWTALHFAVKYW